MQNNEDEEVSSPVELEYLDNSHHDSEELPSSVEDYRRPYIQNTVLTARLHCDLDLSEITLKTVNVEYNPEKFTALIMRKRNPNTTALIFPNGKIVCAGAKQLEDGISSIRRYARTIQRCGYRPKIRDITVQNIAAHCNVGFPILLNDLKKKLPGCIMEPERYAGLVFQIEQTNIVVIIFDTGNMIISGGTNMNEINSVFDEYYTLLKQFIDNTRSPDTDSGKKKGKRRKKVYNVNKILQELKKGSKVPSG